MREQLAAKQIECKQKLDELAELQRRIDELVKERWIMSLTVEQVQEEIMQLKVEIFRRGI